MSKIDFLKEQIIEARTFVNRLMSELPEDCGMLFLKEQILTLFGKWDICLFHRIFIH